eukprot:CAMPEP_0119136624 /NCGR_PEP_ID=MMETSP1310-20130426/21829_1 /TAXON_ID=464262 /ORGANISM="Genus nov. species nov., Strain RCC2339" /LENGTH=98 /DNA_ID=CAMNT_0007127631 /DNA_START=1 /DNA_END=294 /DNA_ORIENTATION=-
MGKLRGQIQAQRKHYETKIAELRAMPPALDHAHLETILNLRKVASELHAGLRAQEQRCSEEIELIEKRLTQGEPPSAPGRGADGPGSDATCVAAWLER